jgi:ATP/ADP translocase
MMSDSFSVGNEDPFLSLMMLIWFVIPITVIASFIFSRKLSSVLISSMPLLNLLLFFVLFAFGVLLGY